jgi:hypothetical protein
MECGHSQLRPGLDVTPGADAEVMDVAECTSTKGTRAYTFVPDPTPEQVTALWSHGVVVAGVTFHQPSMVFAMPRPKLITLAPGSVASIGLSWSDIANGNATCRAAAYASVSLPKGSGSLSGYPGLYEVAPCGGWLRVTPIEMGAVPRAS